MWKYKVSCDCYEEFACEKQIVRVSDVFRTKACAEIAYVGLKACKSVIQGSLKVECFFDEGERE